MQLLREEHESFTYRPLRIYYDRPTNQLPSNGQERSKGNYYTFNNVRVFNKIISTRFTPCSLGERDKFIMFEYSPQVLFISYFLYS